jgi:hypothetical protein
MTCTVIFSLFGLCITRTNRHLLCVYCFTFYAYYMYIAVPIQQGTHIIEYITFGVLLCVTHSDHLAIPTVRLILTNL